jgi:hypothetical protein
MRRAIEIAHDERRLGIGVAQTLDDPGCDARRMRGIAAGAGIDLQDVHVGSIGSRVIDEINIFVAWRYGSL